MFYPSAAVAFHLLYQVRYGFVVLQQACNMYVVGCSSDCNHFAASCVYELPYVGMNSFEMFICYLRTCSLDVKDDMQVYLT